ncbi:DUF2085 domain-containing protein [Fodinibius halophilus]|uniref:DUF2085 domain-containing protein n=1 Tax=Fodinibius halophilus TaxID=1736908 RepID=A0A6M1T2D6_9BACT|nr:DUF2085 domain-containing protein [Fodinibius halophilus]NGP89636.1 DUF2085 domain-containing protein [Fodinibius halophilus]
MQTKQLKLYFLVLVLTCGIVLVALGGGLWNQSGFWLFQWQHQAFQMLCHQLPERSFWINGQPMAVCSRCLGIYSAFAIFWITMPLWAKWTFPNLLSPKKLALSALILNFIDVVGNMLGFWQNTLLSRLVLGILLGSTGALIFSRDFFLTTIKSKGINHGRVTTTNS